MLTKDLDTAKKLIAALFQPGFTESSAPKFEIEPTTRDGRPALRVTCGAMYDKPTYIGKGGVIGMLTGIMQACGGNMIDEGDGEQRGGCETCDWGSFYAREFFVWHDTEEPAVPPAEPEKVDLESILGEHVLSGVDFEQIKGGYNKDEDTCVMRFVLDGKTYVAEEDPSDGYRSSLSYLAIVAAPPVKNTFPPVPVLIQKAPDNEYQKNDFLQFIDATNGEVILEVGTANWDDYYPYFVGRFRPENIHYNKHLAVHVGLGGKL